MSAQRVLPLAHVLGCPYSFRHPLASFQELRRTLAVFADLASGCCINGNGARTRTGFLWEASRESRHRWHLPDWLAAALRSRARPLAERERRAMPRL